MDNELFQKVFDIIQPLLPVGWNKTILYVAYTSGSYSMKYYTKDEKDRYIDCFSNKTVGKAQLIRAFMNIDKIIVPERKKLAEKDQWSIFTLAVDKNGNMKADFDYTDITQNTIEYERRWKEKYLV